MFYSRLQNLLFRPIEIADDFFKELCIINSGSIMLHKGNLRLFNLAISRLPTNDPILDIGSYCGTSTNMLLYYLNKNNKTNKLLTCAKWDFGYSITQNPNVNALGVSYESYNNFIKESFKRNVQFIHPNHLPYAFQEFSNDFFKKWQNQETLTDLFNNEFQLGGKFSFCFIDGNHDYDYVKNDFINCDDHLAKNGFILFDDAADWYTQGSTQFMKEMKKNPKYSFIAKNPNYLFQKIV